MTKDNIEIWYPLKGAVLSQGFYDNANNWYVNHGMMGHGGYDFVTFYNDNVLFAMDGYVYKIINKDNPDFSKFRGVFQLVALDNDYVLELCYGHANKIYCSSGSVKCGDLCISEGNTGDVWAGGQKVSVEAREKGSTAGAHLHIQGRLCRKVKEYDSRYSYLSSQEDATKPYKDGENYYMVDNYWNGYNGCVPMKFGEYAGNYTVYEKIIETLEKVISVLKKLMNGEFTN